MTRISDDDNNKAGGAVKLTVKDRRILGSLFGNARMPFSVIAREVRLSKEAVNYRVRRLMSSGLLAGFNTVIDVRKLGWEMFFVYVRFRNIDAEREGRILSFLESHPNVAQLFRCMGNYDAILKVFARHHADVDVIMKEIEAKFKENFDQYDIDYIVEETAVPFSFLYGTASKAEVHAATQAKQDRKDGRVAVSKAELQILNVLAKNARLSLSEVAEQLGVQRDTVKYHLKKMEREGVILKYRPDTLPKKLGYNWYFLILKTEKLDSLTDMKLKSFVLSHPNVTYLYRTVRSSDIQIELRAKTTEKLNGFLMELRGILKAVLKRVELLTILHEHKYTYVPECMLATAEEE